MLRRRVAVCDNTGAGMVAVSAVFEDDGAYRNGLVHVAVMVEITHRSTVQPAPDGLEAIYQLDCPDLGSAHQGAGGECRGK